VVGAGGIGGRLEDSSQFAGFLNQPVELGTGCEAALAEDVQPVLGLVGLFDDDAELRDELGS
jgi:hypothetical protein